MDNLNGKRRSEIHVSYETIERERVNLEKKPSYIGMA